MDYLLSIIVPLKNNYICTKAIIETFNSIRGSGIELIIHDNTSENNEIVDYLKGIDTSNIKYYYNSDNITMTENFNLGISKANGRYICIIGADDNITEEIISVTKYMVNNNIESAVFHKATYRWPGMRFRIHKKLPSLIIPKCNGKILNIDVYREFSKQLKKGMTSIGKLPEPYHGIIKKEVLEKVRKLTGDYIPGACPDMALAVSLSQAVEKHIYIDAPIVISGQCYNSAGGKGARREHKGLLREMPFLARDIESKWPARIPKIWTGPTIYADSAHSALLAMGKENLFKKFNYARSYANLISFFPEYYNLVNPYIKDNIHLRLSVYIYIFMIFFRRMYIFAKNFMLSNFGITSDTVYNGINTSSDSSIIVSKYLKRKFCKYDYMNCK